MAFRVKKENGKLIFNNLGGYQTRNPSTIWCIEQADAIYNWNDFKEIIIHTGDKDSTDTNYTYSKLNIYTNLVPDFNFYSWPEAGINNYNDTIKEINISGNILPLINKVGWIGNSNTSPIRKQLIQISNINSNIFDCFDMTWINSGKLQLNATKYISLPDLVKTYAILIDIEGIGYSGRVKYLLWSHRPLLLVDRPHKEYFFKYLKEWIHYIPVKRDLSDLLEKTQWIFNNYEKALEIAENAFKFSNTYLTRDACYKQWNTIIQSLSQ